MDTLAAKMAVKFKGIAHFCLNADEKPLLKKSRKYFKAFLKMIS